MAMIGVLGGIGPEATAMYYTALIGSLQHRGLIGGNEDFPQIIINSIPAPELVTVPVPDEALTWYSRGLKELDTHSPDFIVMVCNTIHLFYDRLAGEITSPILDLRAAVYERIRRMGATTVAILGTPSTVTSGLYQFPGLTYYNPDSDQLARLSEAIYDFNRNADRERQIATSREIASDLLNRGADVIVLGCTEFAVMLGDAGLPSINTIDVLVDATIARLIER